MSGPLDVLRDARDALDRLTPEHVRDAIEYAEEGRASHVAWAEHLEAGTCDRCTSDVVDTAGDAAHQREWVRKYDAILAVLREHADMCASRKLLDSIAKIGDEVSREQRARAVRHALRYRAEAATVRAALAAVEQLPGALTKLCDAIHELPEQIEGDLLVAYQDARAALERFQAGSPADTKEDA